MKECGYDPGRFDFYEFSKLKQHLRKEDNAIDKFLSQKTAVILRRIRNYVEKFIFFSIYRIYDDNT